MTSIIKRLATKMLGSESGASCKIQFGKEKSKEHIE